MKDIAKVTIRVGSVESGIVYFTKLYFSRFHDNSTSSSFAFLYVNACQQESTHSQFILPLSICHFNRSPTCYCEKDSLQ